MGPVTHPRVRAQCDLAVPGGEGAVLATDHWWAEGAGGSTVLIRTPYGRRGEAGLARFLAERGHHVVVQSCRGTFGSGPGPFDPEQHEAADGTAALRWIRAQSWSDGRVHSHGFSYAGLTQWATCTAEDRPDSMLIALSSRGVRRAVLGPEHTVGMDTLLTWAYTLALQERPQPARLWGLLRARGVIRRSSFVRPVTEAAPHATGERQRFVQDWLLHDAPAGIPGAIAPGQGELPPVTFLGGWQDLFCERTLADHAELVAAGVPVHLLMGDWTHSTPGPGTPAVRETLRMLAGQPAPAVRLQVTGDGTGVRELASWPPPASTRTWHLGADLSLATGEAVAGSHTRLTWAYDPADPTPAIGGRSLNPFTSGRRDQDPRERRPDVLVFTSTPLPADLEVMGTATADLTVTSTAPRPDLFVRLCDVDPQGRSVDVTDGFIRASAAADHTAPQAVPLDLVALAHRFARGHRLRLQVSSGAHPLFLRNAGTAEPTLDQERLIPSRQELVIGPSALHLPVTSEDVR